MNRYLIDIFRTTPPENMNRAFISHVLTILFLVGLLSRSRLIILWWAMGVVFHLILEQIVQYSDTVHEFCDFIVHLIGFSVVVGRGGHHPEATGRDGPIAIGRNGTVVIGRNGPVAAGRDGPVAAGRDGRGGRHFCWFLLVRYGIFGEVKGA